MGHHQPGGHVHQDLHVEDRLQVQQGVRQETVQRGAERRGGGRAEVPAIVPGRRRHADCHCVRSLKNRQSYPGLSGCRYSTAKVRLDRSRVQLSCSRKYLLNLFLCYIPVYSCNVKVLTPTQIYFSSLL